MVYCIPCECGNQYGVTSANVRLNTRELSKKKKNDSNNALAIPTTHHNSRWEEAKVLSGEEHWTKRKIRESLAIRKRSTNQIVDPSFHLNTNWFTALLLPF